MQCNLQFRLRLMTQNSKTQVHKLKTRQLISFELYVVHLIVNCSDTICWNHVEKTMTMAMA